MTPERARHLGIDLSLTAAGLAVLNHEDPDGMQERRLRDEAARGNEYALNVLLILDVARPR